MAPRTFASAWLKGTFRGSIGKGDFAGSVAGNALTAIAHVVPAWGSTVNDLLWQVPLYGLAGAMIVRLFVAPYELWKTQKERADRAESELMRMKSARPDVLPAVVGGIGSGFREMLADSQERERLDRKAREAQERRRLYGPETD